MPREEVTFPSAGELCAAWLHRPRDGAGTGTCVVMAHGFSMTREDGLAPYAEAFEGAGLHVLAFDHRYLGDSGGHPRQRFRAAEQRADWANAIAFARGLDGVRRIVLWGFSFAGAHVVELAARRNDIAAALVLCPFLDGFARANRTPPAVVAWLLPRAVADRAGRHVLVPVTGPPGSRGAMTLPGELEGFTRAARPGSRWRNAISPGVFLTISLHRPVRLARRIACPLWAGLGERDVSVSNRAVERLAARAPRGELARYPYDHFEPFYDDGPARVAADQVAFLRRCGLSR